MKINKREKHKHGAPGPQRLKQVFQHGSDIGKRKWHRVFGYVTVTHPYNQLGKTLVMSEYKHVMHFIPDQGWMQYKGNGPDGKIQGILVHRSELFDYPQKDDEQKRIGACVKVIA